MLHTLFKLYAHTLIMLYMLYMLYGLYMLYAMIAHAFATDAFAVWLISFLLGL